MFWTLSLHSIGGGELFLSYNAISVVTVIIVITSWAFIVIFTYSFVYFHVQNKLPIKTKDDCCVSLSEVSKVTIQICFSYQFQWITSSILCQDMVILWNILFAIQIIVEHLNFHLKMNTELCLLHENHTSYKCKERKMNLYLYYSI